MISDFDCPDHVVKAILDADAIGCARGIAAFAHPDYCADLKRRQVFSLKAQSGSLSGIGTTDLGAATIGEAKVHLEGMLRAAFDVGSIRELEAMDEVSFVERVMSALYWSLPPRFGRSEFLGTVMRNEEEAHAVIAQSGPLLVAGKYPKVVAMTLRKIGGEWRSLLNGGMAIDAQHPLPFGAYSKSQYRWVTGMNYRK